MEIAKIYEEPHSALFPMHLFVEGWAWKLKDKAGEDMQSNALVFRNGGVEWYTEEIEQTKVAKALLERLMKNSFETVRDNTTQLLKETEKNTQRMPSLNFSTLENSQLAEEYKHYCNFVVELNSWGTLVTLMEMGHESVVTDAVYAYAKKKGQEIGKVEKALESIGTLCAPVQPTFLRFKKIEVLKTALQSKKNGMQNVEVQRSIDEMHGKYLWVSYGYVGPELNREEFEKEVANYANKPVEEIAKELEETMEEDERTKAQQNKLEEELHFGYYGKRLCELARTFMFQKEYRKQVLYHSFYVFRNLQKEIAKRAGISLNQAAWIMPSEVGQLLEGKFDSAKLNERKLLSVYLPFQHKLLSGKEAQEFVAKLKTEEVDTSLRELSGQGAFAGPLVEGIVKVIMNAHDLHKLQPGDILVSPATSPVMAPVMRIAGAIVTDQGGLTCHAAIVSRELRKQCVIGTKIATKVLRDGEKIRVDSVNGKVTRLEPIGA